MQAAEFQKMVQSLANKKPKTVKDQLYYNAGGMVSDAGEVLDAMKDYYWYGRITNWPDFRIKMAEELGDTLHWITAVCNVLNIPLSTLMETNKAKLTVRYPKGFDKKACNQRNKDKEWEAMQDAVYKTSR